jgi:hypothetical protein
MASRTSWVADALGQGLTYGLLFNGTDITTGPLGNGQTVLSTVADIANNTNLAMFMDISYRLTIASSTIAAGANIAFWIYNKNQNATAYGDNQFTAGTAATLTPAFPPAAVVGIPAVASTTDLYGTSTGIIIPPGIFRVAMQNNSGFALSSTLGSQAVMYRSYNINLNA